MRKNHPLLRMVYILTDSEPKWAEEVRMWLLSEGWDRVFIGKQDVYDKWEDHEVGVGADMEVARRAGVFVGNGVSVSSLAMRVGEWEWKVQEVGQRGEKGQGRVDGRGQAGGKRRVRRD